MNIRIFRIFFALVVFSVLCSAKLNVPRVLLPNFGELSINFTLEATDGGCYIWNTTRPDIIDLQPLGPHEQFKCSRKIVIATSIKSKITLRTTAIILAEEIDTKQALYCDVIVDVIDSLRIVTKTHELFIEEAPEAFQVRAYDTQGNEFSTLDGVEFQWSIVPDAISDSKTIKPSDQNVLRFIKFMDSSYETPASIIEFERRNLQGNVVLLEGVKTGSAKVTVKLAHIEYNRLNGTEVSLVVVANLILEPSNVFLVRGDSVQYQIYHVHQGRLEVIRFPSQQYYLEPEDKTVLRAVGTSGGEIAALKEGRSRVFLHDRNVVGNELESSTKKPSAWITVARPHRIELVLWPHFNWAVIKGREYALSVDMFTENNEKMQLGAKVIVNLNVSDQQKFMIRSCTTNGSWCYGFANELGETKVHAHLVHVATSEHLTKPLPFAQKLRSSALIRIYPEIEVKPPLVYLPWHLADQSTIHNEFVLKASGGDGKFLWSTNDSMVAAVTQAGLVRIVNRGVFTVSVAMLTNPNVKAHARLYIVPVTWLKIDSLNPDVALNSFIYVNVFLFGDSVNGTRMVFNDCHKLPFRVMVSDEFFVFNETVSNLNDEQPQHHCAVIKLRAINEGHGEITVSYKLNDGYEIADTIRLSVFKPLRLLPQMGLSSENVLVLAVETSADLEIVDGPQKILPDDKLKRLIETDPVGFIKTVVMNADRNIVRVVCGRNVSLTRFEFSVENERTKTRDMIRVLVECVRPHSISLAAKESACPHLNTAENIVDVRLPHLTIELSLKDAKGRVLGNISGFDFEYELDNLGREFIEIDPEPSRMLAGRKYIRLRPQRQQIGRFHVIVWLKTPEKLTGRLNIRLVKRLRIEPQTVSVFNTVKNRQRLELVDGSNYFRVESEPRDVLSVQFRASDRFLFVEPLRIGHAIVTVQDLCFNQTVVQARVAVVEIARIRIEGLHIVQVGDRARLLVRFYDTDDRAVFVPDLKAIQFKVNVYDRDLLTVKISDSVTSGDHVLLDVNALNLGETKLQIEALQNNEQTIKSAVFSIQIYAPLRIAPKLVTLTISGTYQLELIGGPQVDANIKFECASFEGSLNEPVIVSSTGVVTAVALGAANVTASVLDSLGAVARPAFDSVRVEVIALEAVRIATPIKRAVRGAVLPIRVRPVPDTIDELGFGSVSLSCQWLISDLDVFEMFGSFDSLNVRYGDSDAVFGRLRALNAGRAIVKVIVTVDERLAGVENGGDNRTFEAYTELEVFESLRLITEHSTPITDDGHHILLTPLTEYQLETNKDRLASTQITYRIFDLPTNASKPDDQLVTVTDQGLLKSFNAMGKCSLLIQTFDSNNGLIESLLLLIEIKPVFYLVAMTSATWVSGALPGIEQPSRLPLGADILYKIDYFDNFGRRFIRTNCEPAVQMNRRDLIGLKSANHGSSFVTSAQHNNGKTVMKINTKDSSIAAKANDFILIHAEQSIRPFLTRAVIGDVICFANNLIGMDSRRGQWQSGDRNLLSIDSELGLAQVLGTQTAPVTVHHSLATSSNLHLYLLPVTQISIVPGTYNITNIPNDMVRVPIVLAGNGHRPQKNFFDGGNGKCRQTLENITTIESPFVCHLTFVSANSMTFVDVTKTFKTRARFVWEMGHVCEIGVRPMHGGGSFQNATAVNDYLLLRVHYDGFRVGTMDTYELRSVIKIGFNPAIYLFTTTGIISGSATEQPQHMLELDDELLSGRFYIAGQQWIVEQVRIVAVNDNENRIRIGSVDQIGPANYKVNVRLTGLVFGGGAAQPLPHLLVESPVTKQSIRIGIRTKAAIVAALAPKCGSGPYGSPILDAIATFGFQSSLILVVIIAILTVLFYVYPKWWKPTINLNVSTNDSMFNDSLRMNSLNKNRTRILFSPHNKSMSSTSNSSRIYCYGDDSLNSSRF